MNSASLKPLQMIGVSLSAIATTANSSGLLPASSPKLNGLPNSQDFFDHLPLLVDFDRIDAAVVALVVVLGDAPAKGCVNLAQPVLEDAGEADQDRQIDAAQLQSVDELFQIDPAIGLLRRDGPARGHFRRRKNSLCPSGPLSYNSAASVAVQRWTS